jgi:hypothetical protein
MKNKQNGITIWVLKQGNRITSNWLLSITVRPYKSILITSRLYSIEDSLMTNSSSMTMPFRIILDLWKLSLTTLLVSTIEVLVRIAKMKTLKPLKTSLRLFL